MFRVLCSITVLAGALLAGCSTMTFQPHPTLEGLPEVKKSPLHAGVYYSPQFAAYEHVRKSGNIAVHMAMGAASMPYFDALFSRVFERTTRVETLSAEALEKKGVDVVVAPSIEHFDFPVGLEPYSERYGVVYRITLYTPRGVPAASWLVRGTADQWKMIGGHLEAYMQEAGKQFLETFDRESAPVLALIAAHRKSSGGIDVAALGLAARRTELAELGKEQVEHLRQAGFVCVEVTSRPKTQRPLLVRASDMHLRLKDGRVVDPLPPSSLLEVTATATAVSTNVYPSLVGALVTLAESSAAGKRSSGERELLDSTVGGTFFGERVLRQEKGEDGGVVFFRLPEKASDEGASVIAWVVDPQSADGAEVEMPLAGATPLR